MTGSAPRSSFLVTVTVWKAIFLREAVSRLSAGRAAWLWILLDPLIQVIMFMVLFGFILHRLISGIDAAMFLMTGRLGFSMVKTTSFRCMGAIKANAALFAYRQVTPVDTVLVRAALEGLLLVVCTILLLLGAGFFGFPVVPHDPLLVLLTFAMLWLLGLGLGLIFSVVAFLVPEIGKVINFTGMPLYLLSCVMYPAMSIPAPLRGWLMLNPIANGMELLHGAYFEQYHIAPEASVLYLGLWALGTVFLGLTLHLRFAVRLAAQ